MVPKIWASANTIKLSDEWSYLFYVLWFEDDRYPGEPIQHNIVFKDHCYIHNSQETYERVFRDIAFHMKRMEIKMETYVKDLEEKKDEKKG